MGSNHYMIVRYCMYCTCAQDFVIAYLMYIVYKGLVLFVLHVYNVSESIDLIH